LQGSNPASTTKILVGSSPFPCSQVTSYNYSFKPSEVRATSIFIFLVKIIDK
jgi:hypothetical protein